MVSCEELSQGIFFPAEENSPTRQNEFQVPVPLLRQLGALEHEIHFVDIFPRRVPNPFRLFGRTVQKILWAAAFIPSAKVPVAREAQVRPEGTRSTFGTRGSTGNHCAPPRRPDVPDR